MLYTDVFRFPNKKTEYCKSSTKYGTSTDFSMLNLNIVDFGKVDHYLKLVNWNTIITANQIEEFPEKFKSIIFDAIVNSCPSNVFIKKSRQWIFSKTEKNYQ